MQPNIFSVENKVVVVTGSARGNGQAIAEGFLEHGAIVIFLPIERCLMCCKNDGELPDTHNCGRPSN
jgi:hypothetical protein